MCKQSKCRSELELLQTLLIALGMENKLPKLDDSFNKIRVNGNGKGNLNIELVINESNESNNDDVDDEDLVEVELQEECDNENDFYNLESYNDEISENGYCCDLNLHSVGEPFTKEEMYTEDTNEKSKQKVQVIDVGGKFNYLTYNALLHICEYEFFADCEVYDGEEWKEPEDIDVIVLITNEWNKIYESSAKEYADYLEKGVQIFILKPEFIELIKINNEHELLQYAMTAAQSEGL